MRLATRFDLEQVAPTRAYYSEAWALPVALDVCARIVLQVPPRFPFELPHVFLEEAPAFGELSHVNEDGRFCFIDGSGIAYGIDRIADAVEEAVDRALQALRDPVALRSDDEFRKELFPYLPTSGRFYSLLTDLESIRKIFVVRLKEPSGDGVGLVACETEEEGRRWLDNARLGKVLSAEEATFVPEAVPGRPPFPSSVGELYGWMESARPELADVWLNSVRTHPTFVTAVGSSLGPNLVAWRHERSEFAKPRTAPARPGFRQGRYPVRREMLTERVGERVRFLQGERVDRERLASRTEPSLGGARPKVVVLVGAGSVGSHAIEMICDAVECGTIAIFDGDLLGTENVLRHTGKWNEVGYLKSSIVAYHLERKHPGMTVAHHGDAIRDYDEFAAAAVGADLVVLATGSEETDGFLAKAAHWLGRNGLVTAQLWVEAEAETGHILLHAKGEGACPSCGHIERARLEFGALRQEPGCGGAFANYGGSRLQRFLAIAVDYVANASVSEKITWRARVGGALTSDRVDTVPLPATGCPECNA